LREPLHFSASIRFPLRVQKSLNKSNNLLQTTPTTMLVATEQSKQRGPSAPVSPPLGLVAPPAPPAPFPGPLVPLEAGIIDLFVQLSRVLGQPRSYGEIYGLLFISARPLAMDDLIARLRISKGSASQGLKYLRQLGAVREIYVPGERRVHYEAVAELRGLVSRFLRDQVLPQLQSGEEKLGHLAALVKAMPAVEREQVIGRVRMLQSWGKNARRAVSLVSKAI
jgi:HTH-type transcriptional regulator, glycine betaine synthesis regulator